MIEGIIINTLLCFAAIGIGEVIYRTMGGE